MRWTQDWTQDWTQEHWAQEGELAAPEGVHRVAHGRVCRPLWGCADHGPGFPLLRGCAGVRYSLYCRQSGDVGAAHDPGCVCRLLQGCVGVQYWLCCRQSGHVRAAPLLPLPLFPPLPLLLLTLLMHLCQCCESQCDWRRGVRARRLGLERCPRHACGCVRCRAGLQRGTCRGYCTRWGVPYRLVRCFGRGAGRCWDPLCLARPCGRTRTFRLSTRGLSD